MRFHEILHEYKLDTLRAYGEDFQVYMNPSYRDLKGLLQKFPELRGHTIGHKTVIMWDAMVAGHGDVHDALDQMGLVPKGRRPYKDGSVDLFVTDKDFDLPDEWEYKIKPLPHNPEIKWAAYDGDQIGDKALVNPMIKRMMGYK